MIKNIKIKNFKILKDVDIDLCDTLNVISGLSAEGKTAFLSSLKLLCTNKPSGSDYISYFAKEPQKTSVKIQFNNCNVEFKKTKKTAEYILDEDKEKSFTELNKKVPDEIFNAILMDDDNFSWQFDMPYLLFGPKSEISKKINDVIGIQKFDDKLKEINKEILSLNKDFKSTKSEVQDLKIKKKDLRFISEIESKFKELEVAERKIKKEESRVEVLDNIKERLKKKEKIKDLKKIVYKVQGLFDDIDELRYENNYDKLLKIKSTIENKKSIKEKYKKINDIYIDVKTLTDKKNEIELNLKEIKNKIILTEKIKYIKKNISRINQELNEIKMKINEFKVCPTCGSELKEVE